MPFVQPPPVAAAAKHEQLPVSAAAGQHVKALRSMQHTLNRRVSMTSSGTSQPSSPGANLAAQGCAGALGQGVQDVGRPLAAGLQHAVHVLPSRVSFGRSAAW
jgi:hypothetical protein